MSSSSCSAPFPTAGCYLHALAVHARSWVVGQWELRGCDLRYLAQSQNAAQKAIGVPKSIQRMSCRVQVTYGKQSRSQRCSAASLIVWAARARGMPAAAGQRSKPAADPWMSWCSWRQRQRPSSRTTLRKLAATCVIKAPAEVQSKLGERRDCSGYTLYLTPARLRWPLRR